MQNSQHGKQDFKDSNGLLLAPAYHKSGYEVIRTLKQVIDRTECGPGQHLEQKQFGCLLGVSRSTIHDWFHGELAGPIQNFLCAFERLSEADRILVLREFCRQCPRLEHPRLAHDTRTLQLLRASLHQKVGLTIVIGPSEPRTFLVTAMGHSITRVEATGRVCGLDIHRPDSFVPVAGVNYCQNPPDSEQARPLAALALEDVESSTAELVIFNGIGIAISQFPTVIRRLATTRHLIVADDCGLASDEILRICPHPLAVLVVSKIQGKQSLIHVDVRASETLRGGR